MPPGKTDKESALIRGLGIWAATAIVIGAVIGQSVFLVASEMAREVGSVTRVLAVWIGGGIVVLCAECCYAELGAAIPEAGGDYVYLNRGIGSTWGFLYGWTSSMVMQPASRGDHTFPDNSGAGHGGLQRFSNFRMGRRRSAKS